MRIIKLIKNKKASNECGGYRPPKGHLDTQMYPECEGTPCDRNIVKKTVERRKKGKNKKKASIGKEAKLGYPISGSDGIWSKWKNGSMSDEEFVKWILKNPQLFMVGLTKDPIVRNGINTALKEYQQTNNANTAAHKISSFLSMGDQVSENYFAQTAINWIKKADGKLD